MKKYLKMFLGAVGIVVILVLGSVIFLSGQYYRETFCMGVWINGSYCTGMTPEQIAQQLNATYHGEMETISVQDISGEVHILSLEEYGVSIDFAPVVEAIFQKNHGYWWLGHIGKPQRYHIKPEYCYNTEEMKAKLAQADWLNQNLYHPENTVSIVKSAEAGYILVDETQDLLLKDQAIQVICDGISNQLTQINLASPENKVLCYQSVAYTDEMKELLAKWQGIQAFQDFHMVYQFGDKQEIIDENIVAEWMTLDENGAILFDENYVPLLDKTMIQEYIAYLCATYDTVGTERNFQTTRGDIVTVSSSGYGNQLDAKAEYAFLLNAFQNKESGVRTPIYLSEAKEKGLDDIGDTYIEVDMGSQQMYYYQDGQKKIETPIVTGNLSRRWGTPAKVCSVYFKQRNRVLRGANYATPVKYWMAVDGHIGIHDATWRSDFGGEIYKTNGSHGCINTPFEIMTELYDMVELGTPVIMFY